jgi:hypothetical protein
MAREYRPVAIHQRASRRVRPDRVRPGQVHEQLIADDGEVQGSISGARAGSRLLTVRIPNLSVVAS